MNSLQRLVAVMVKHRRFIIWDVLLVTAGVAVYSLLAPKVYTSQARILPPVEEASMISLPSMLSSFSTGGIARLGGNLRGTQSSDLVAAILTSRTIAERVIDSCDYLRFFKKRKLETALKALRKNTAIGVSDEGIVGLAVSARNAEYATQLARSYIAELDRFLRESNMTRGKNTRIFVEKRLAEAEVELALAGDSLTAFQKRHRVAAVDVETKAAVDAYAELQAEKAKIDIELRLATDLAGTENPYVLTMRQRQTEVDRQLAGLEQGTGKGFGIGFGVPLKGIPDVAAEYVRRLAEYRTKQELCNLLVQQYEQARITEVRDTPAITVLDAPKVPEERSAPKRTRMTLTAFFLSLAGGLAIAFLLESWQTQSDESRQGWRRVRDALRGPGGKNPA